MRIPFGGSRDVSIGQQADGVVDWTGWFPIVINWALIPAGSEVVAYVSCKGDAGTTQRPRLCLAVDDSLVVAGALSSDLDFVEQVLILPRQTGLQTYKPRSDLAGAAAKNVFAFGSLDLAPAGVTPGVMPGDTLSTTMWSIATIKEYLSIPLSETDRDILLVQIANRVTAEFERRTSRLFVIRTGLTEQWLGSGATARFLRHAPLTAVASIVVDGVTLTEGVDYLVNLSLGMVSLKSGTFGAGTDCLATFSAGFGAKDDPETLPTDIYEAGLEQVKAIFDERRSSAISATSVSIGPASLVVKPGMAYNIRNVLESLRDMRA